jgi:hypothetical protein
VPMRCSRKLPLDKGISSSGIRIGFSHGLRRVWSTHTTW